MEENSQKSKKTVYYSGFTVALVTALVGAYVLFYITDLKPVSLFHTTKYLLTQEMGMSFYNAPDGEEQTVMFLDDAPDAPAIEEVRQEGERWLDFSKVKVEAPVNGWAKVDIGDDGAPLYVEQEYVTSEEASLFEGRKASNSFMATGVRNLPPAGWMWLMGISLYFFLFYPWWLVLKSDLTTQEGKNQLLHKASYLAYAALLYFVLLFGLKFICGYNLSMHWFVSGNYLGSSLLAVINVIFGILGVAGLFCVLYRFFNDSLDAADGPWAALRKLDWKGVLLLIAGVYFILIFLGVLIGIIVICACVYFFLTKLLPAMLASHALLGGGKQSVSPTDPESCYSCAYYQNTLCTLHAEVISDPSGTRCRDYKHQ